MFFAEYFHFSCKIAVEKVYFWVTDHFMHTNQKKVRYMLQKSFLLPPALCCALLLGAFSSLSAWAQDPKKTPQNPPPAPPRKSAPAAPVQAPAKPAPPSAREKKYAEFSPLPDPAAAEKAVREKIRILSGKKLELLKKMHVTRMELIRKDQRLAALHKRILALSLELSQELNAKREMASLNEDLAAIEEEMRTLLKTNAPAAGQKQPRKQ